MSNKRHKTRDAAIKFRMGAGYPGDVNRTHPASIEPVLVDPALPLTAFGQAVLLSASNAGVRPFAAADQHDSNIATAYGISVRPYPFQQQDATNFGAAAFGAGVPPKGAADILRSGYIMGKIPAGQVVAKGGAVYVWCTASTGSHVQGLFEGALDAGDTVRIAGATFNGPADADGNVEIAFNI